MEKKETKLYKKPYDDLVWRLLKPMIPSICIGLLIGGIIGLGIGDGLAGLFSLGIGGTIGLLIGVKLVTDTESLRDFMIGFGIINMPLWGGCFWSLGSIIDVSEKSDNVGKAFAIIGIFFGWIFGLGFSGVIKDLLEKNTENRDRFHNEILGFQEKGQSRSNKAEEHFRRGEYQAARREWQDAIHQFERALSKAIFIQDHSIAQDLKEDIQKNRENITKCKIKLEGSDNASGNQ